MHAIPRNIPCPCGSRRRYKNCCAHKDFQWVPAEGGRFVRSMAIDHEWHGLIAALHNLFRQLYACSGQDPATLGPEEFTKMTAEWMRIVGIEPALIHAFVETGGLMLNDENESRFPDTDIAEWESAIEEYEYLHNTKATRHRLTRKDFERAVCHQLL